MIVRVPEADKLKKELPEEKGNIFWNTNMPLFALNLWMVLRKKR